MKITNTQEGPRGINTVSGPMLVEPRQTIDAKVYEREREHITASGWFETDGEFEPNPAASAGAQVTVTNADGKDGVYIPASEFNAMRASFESLTAENKDLREKLADAGKGGQQKPDEFKAPFEAKDKGAGWWAIYDAGGKEVKSLRKDDAEIFNSLSDENKAAEVAKK